MIQKAPKAEELSRMWIKFDDRDRKLVNLLNKDARLTLRELASQVSMSIDGVKKRINRLRESGAIERFAVLPNPKAFGLPLGVHVYIKLANIKEENLKEFLNHLKFHNRIIILMSMLGDYDIYFVMLAKDTSDMNEQKTTIRKRFSGLIADWKEVVVAEIHKYEEYQF